MTRRPVITGIGLLTPLGASAPLTWEALLSGRFIRDHARLDAGTGRQSRIGSIAIVAAREAMTNAGWPDAGVADPSCALVVGTSKGPVEKWIAASSGYILSHQYDPAGHENVFGVGQLSHELSEALRLPDGPRLALSAACASGLHALIRAAMMIRAGEVHRALVVAAEASVHPLFVGSFKRLGVLPRPGIGCRPMDETRDGFLMSEAAAAVCLEAIDDLRESEISRRAWAVIDRFALGGDATHLTGGDSRATTLRHLLAHVIRQDSIDLVHAHATGTVLNDPVELAAINDALPARQPPTIVYSHKGALGHSLGAAGLVSVVINCMAHRRGIVPPNVQTTHPLPATRLRIIPRDPTQVAVHRSVAIATGFGGPTAAIGLKTP